jgi:hypothetical protein
VWVAWSLLGIRIFTIEGSRLALPIISVPEKMSKIGRKPAIATTYDKGLETERGGKRQDGEKERQARRGCKHLSPSPSSPHLPLSFFSR